MYIVSLINYKHLENKKIESNIVKLSPERYEINLFIDKGIIAKYVVHIVKNKVLSLRNFSQYDFFGQEFKVYKELIKIINSLLTKQESKMKIEVLALNHRTYRIIIKNKKGGLADYEVLINGHGISCTQIIYKGFSPTEKLDVYKKLIETSESLSENCVDDNNIDEENKIKYDYYIFDFSGNIYSFDYVGGKIYFFQDIEWVDITEKVTSEQGLRLYGNIRYDLAFKRIPSNISQIIWSGDGIEMFATRMKSIQYHKLHKKINKINFDGSTHVPNIGNLL